MSTNAYESRQTISYHEPTDYFGWYVSGSSWSASAHFFKSEAARDAWRAAIAKALGVEVGSWEAEVSAGLLCLRHFHDSEQEQEGADETLSDLWEHDPEALERAREAASAIVEAL